MRPVRIGFTGYVIVAAACVASVQVAAAQEHQVGGAARALEPLYQSGQAYSDFLEAADARRAMWIRNTRNAELTPDAVERASALNGSYHLLAVAIAGCSDSANTLPYLARLVAEYPAIGMRIVHPDSARWIMEENPTPDGRAATPTVLVLDASFQVIGAFVERPAGLQEWALEHRSRLSSGEFLREKFAWYDKDAGRQTIAEVLAIIEASRLD